MISVASRLELTLLRMRLAVAALLLSIIGASCAIPVDSEPEVLDDPEYAAIIEGTTSTTVGDTGANAVPITLYFVHPETEELETVERTFDPADISWQTIFAALKDGPNETETEGFEVAPVTRLPPSLEIISDDSNPILQLQGEELEGLAEPRKRSIFAQTVCTLTELDSPIAGVELYEIVDETTNQIFMLDESDAQPVTVAVNREHVRDCITGTEQAEIDAESTTTTESG